MNTLIITLPLDLADKSTLLDCVQSPDGRILASHTSVPMALLPPADASTDVIAVVPLQALSWHRVNLPQGSLPRSLMAERSSHRLRAILDGLLEDQLLDDPAHLHLALQPQPQVGAPVWVAACDRVWLSAALGALSQAGYNAVRIVPESTPQALADVIEVTGEPPHIKVAGWVGPLSMLHGDEKRSAAATSAARVAEDGRAGVLVSDLSATTVALFSTDTMVVAEPAVAAVAERIFQRPVTLQQRGQRLLVAAQSPWDLAQFEFTNAQRDPRWANLSKSFQRFVVDPVWRAARWSLVLLILVNILGLNIWAMREKALLAEQREAVRAVLTDTFPKVPVVVDAPLQMAREVAVLQRASGSAAGSDLESLLSSFASFSPVGYAPKAIEYAANELRLSGATMTPTDQEQVTAGLKALGISASVQGDAWMVRAGVAR